MSFLSSRYGVAMVASESTYGTDQIDIDLNADTDVVYQKFESCKVTEVGTMLRPNTVRATHDNEEHVYVKNGATVEITGFLTGKSGSAGTAPDYAAVLKAANLKETVNAATSVVYNAQTERQSGMTVVKHDFEVDTTKSRMKYTEGVIGNCSFSMAANDFAKFSFSGTGLSHNVHTDDLQYFEASTGKPLLDNGGSSITYAGTYAYSAKSPIVCKSMTVTFAGTTYNVANVNIDVAFGTGTLDTVNGATTYNQVFNTRGGDAPVSGSFQLVSSAADYDDFLSKFPASTPGAMVFTVTDGTDTISFSLPNAQLGVAGDADVNGIAAYEIPFFGAVNATAGNDSLTITYT